MENIPISPFDEYHRHFEDQALTDDFAAKNGVGEADIVGMLQQIGSLLDKMGIPHLFMTGYALSRSEFNTYTHTIGSFRSIETLIMAACVREPEYEHFFVELGQNISKLDARGLLKVKRELYHAGKLWDK